jgi:hypothetical protein
MRMQLRLCSVGLVCLGLAGLVLAQDAVKVDPKHYSVITTRLLDRNGYGLTPAEADRLGFLRWRERKCSCPYMQDIATF